MYQHFWSFASNESRILSKRGTCRITIYDRIKRFLRTFSNSFAGLVDAVVAVVIVIAVAASCSLARFSSVTLPLACPNAFTHNTPPCAFLWIHRHYVRVFRYQQWLKIITKMCGFFPFFMLSTVSSNKSNRQRIFSHIMQAHTHTHINSLTEIITFHAQL